MTFTITPLVWDGTSKPVPQRKAPPMGMMTYADAALMFGYSENRIAHLASEGRVEGGGGFVSIAGMKRWTDGRPELKPKERAA